MAMESRNLKPKIYVRRARSSDRRAVFKFCEKTWSWGDYIPQVWAKWLKDKNSRVFVATINDVPVGIAHLSIDKPHEVWLSGARTDPNYRRMGVATGIIKKCLEYARRKSARVARLATMSDNIAAQAALQKWDFKPIAEFLGMVAEDVRAERSEHSKWAEESKTQAIWNYLQTSEAYRKAAGLYTVLFHYYSLEKQDLSHFIKLQKVIMHVNEKSEVDGLTLIDDTTAKEWRENSIQTCYVDGDYNTVLDMIKFLKSHCHALGVKRIYGFACNHQPITTALQKLGFKPPEAIDIVYEKKI